MSLEEKIDLLLKEVAELKAARTGSAKILTVAEAMDYVKIVGVGMTPARRKAFYRWRKRWRVPAKHRYSTEVLDLALSREAGVVRVPKSLRRAA